MAGSGPIPAAFYRMALASIILAYPAMRKIRQTMSILTGQEKWLMLLSGSVLGLHFATWVTSLFYTTISNSVIIVSTQPIWVLIMEVIFLKSRLRKQPVIGMIIAIVGMIIISHGDLDLGTEYLIGDLLALAGAIFAAIYLIIGRKLRAKLDNIDYVFPVYTVAAICLLLIGLFRGENMHNFRIETWMFFILLALVPTVVGHSLYNWLLKYVDAHKVATTILGEPIGATILAIIFFDQIPSWWTAVGGVFILAGIFIVLKRKTDPKKELIVSD
jgi:drug/metabolite transporter (DMT)-like permease